MQDTGSPVLWISDPMHGNTESTSDGIKTRRFGKKLTETDFPSNGAGLCDGFVGIMDEDKQLCAVLEINKALKQYKYCCVIEN